MDIIDIYGPIPNKSELTLGIGTYNTIDGLLTLQSNILKIQTLKNINNIIELILTYENKISDRIYFSLAVKNSNKFINIQIELINDKNVAYACISKSKCLFWIDYSSIDKNPRSQLFSAVLYSLKTSFGEQDYVVTWKIDKSLNKDLIIFLPTTWYESSNCEINQGIDTLIDKLTKKSFKGFTTQQWCEELSFIKHCTNDQQCGECLGNCPNINHICYVDTQTPNSFICGPKELEPKILSTNVLPSNSSNVNCTYITWIVIISIFIIVAFLTWGLSYRN